MAYQFADGFDNYGNNYTLVAGYPWDIAPNSASTTSTADVRFTAPGSLPGACMVNSGSGNVLRKILSGNQATLIVSVGYKITSLPGSSQGNNQEICSFWDGSTEQVCLAVTNNGALQFYRGNTGGTAIGTASANGTITAGTWHGLAIQVTFSSTTGAVQLYLNGSATPTINSSSLNTIVSANAYATQVGLGGNVNAAVAAHYDDFICLDTTGVTLNSLLGGDARILTKLPSAAGNYTNWTPNGLASNYQNGAVTPPSVSDYNSNNTGGTKDSYTMQSASLTVAPYFVVARASLTRDDAGPHTPSLFIRSGSTDSSGTATSALSSSYVFYDAVFATDPNTSSAWTGPGADAAQVGIIEG